jgi:uncharacterized membrane protein
MHLYAYAVNDWKAPFAAFDILFTVLMFGGVGALLRRPYPRGSSCGGVPCSSEEKLLFEKFANGKIDDDEYRRRRETLRSVR